MTKVCLVSPNGIQQVPSVETQGPECMVLSDTLITDLIIIWSSSTRASFFCKQRPDLNTNIIWIPIIIHRATQNLKRPCAIIIAAKPLLPACQHEACIDHICTNLQLLFECHHHHTHTSPSSSCPPCCCCMR